MTVQAVPRTVKQRREALLWANQVRVRRAEIKVEMRWGDTAASDVLRYSESETANWKVRDLLLAAPKFGAQKADRALAACRVSHSKTCGGLSVRRLSELLAYLDGR